MTGAGVPSQDKELGGRDIVNLRLRGNFVAVVVKGKLNNILGGIQGITVFGKFVMN
jgi:hypothetical protein